MKLARMSTHARAVYHTALAIVPPTAETDCWVQLQDIRRTLRDKGFYRWPPRVNLVYPFVDADRFDEIANLLVRELACVEPFDIKLERFGTFGGNKKGVCYLVPETDPDGKIANLYDHVHSVVSQLIPCPEPCRFTPHLTVAHTQTGRDAQRAADESAPNLAPMMFHVREIYILIRCPPTDQYAIACRIPLGVDSRHCAEILTSPICSEVERFEYMPVEEEDWVKDVSKNLSSKTRVQDKKKKK